MAVDFAEMESAGSSDTSGTDGRVLASLFGEKNWKTTSPMAASINESESTKSWHIHLIVS